MCVCVHSSAHQYKVFVLNSDFRKSLVSNQWWKTSQIPLLSSEVEYCRQITISLPYHYHIISITLLRHSLARRLRTCYQLIERFNPLHTPTLHPFSSPPSPPSVHLRCVFHLSKADVIEVEHWIYQLNEITQTLHDQPGPLSYTFRELLLWNLVALHPIQNF